MGFHRFQVTQVMLCLSIAVFTSPTLAQKSGASIAKTPAVISGKSMTVHVEPGQKLNIHLLPENGSSNQTDAIYEIVLQPQKGKITAVARKMGVVSYVAGAAGWSEDSFQFVITNKAGVRSAPATIQILPAKAVREGTLVAESITAKFFGPLSIKGLP